MPWTIFFADLDGTFVTSRKTISPASWRALDAVAQAGLEFVPCTGRPLSGLEPELLAHPAVRHAVYANGAGILDARTGEVIHRECLGRERALKMYEPAKDRDVTFDIFADGRSYATRDHYDRLSEFLPDPNMCEGIRRSRTPVDKTVPQILDEVDEVERVSMYWKDPADRDVLWPAAEALGHVSVVRSYAMNIEVSDADATKGRALEWLCEHLGIPVEESVGFGDSLNDISMIEAAGLGVAMANGDREAREAARLIAPANDDDGVAEVVMACLEGRLSLP